MGPDLSLMTQQFVTNSPLFPRTHTPLTVMEDGSRPSSSRKRHRSEERSGSSFKLSHPTGIDLSSNSRVQDPVAHSTPTDVLLPTLSEGPAPILQPLHPPIPNFSAISQGAPRPTPIAHASADPPASMIYNIAVPLPNPGRAHRFCQACDHVNHVRRKLCENCGAPKPSAVRNAVGVRSVNDPDLPQDRNNLMCAKKEYGTDAYFQRQPRDHLYGQPPGHDFQSRQLIQGIPQGADHRRKSEPVLHQAHSLAMRCPGDDIPLLGSVHRGGQQSPYNFSETAQASNRVRMGQTLLSEPLVNFGGVASQDQKGFRRRSYGNVVDVTQKVFPDPSNDRDQGALPSVHGISNQSLGQLVVPAQRVASHAQQMETQVSRSFANFQRTSENAPTEEVIPLNRGAFIQDLEVRPGLPRYQNMQSMRQVRNDQTQSYPEGMEGPATTAYAYPQHQDFFPLPQQFRNDERDNALRIEEGRRQSFSETLGGNPEAEKCFPSTQGDVGGAHKSHLTLGRYVGQHGDNAARLRMDKSAAGPLKMESRGDIVQVGHLPHITDQVNSGHLDDSNRPSDDGRFAIENILMQHKNSGPSE